MNTIETPVDHRDERRRKRRPLIAAALAILAVGGVGAAATSAAWTDDLFFGARAQAATFNLQGSFDGASWTESDDAGAIELIVPPSVFADLLPGQERDVTMHVKNAGSVTAAITSSATFETGATFAQAPSIEFDDVDETIAAGASDSFVLKVSTPPTWSADNRGASGTIVVKITGTATSVQ